MTVETSDAAGDLRQHLDADHGVLAFPGVDTHEQLIAEHDAAHDSEQFLYRHTHGEPEPSPS